MNKDCIPAIIPEKGYKYRLLTGEIDKASAYFCLFLIAKTNNMPTSITVKAFKGDAKTMLAFDIDSKDKTNFAGFNLWGLQNF